MTTQKNQDPLQKQRLAKATQFVKQGNDEQAITCLKDLLCHAPEHDIAMGMLAAIYVKIGLLEKAKHLYQQALQVNAENQLARFQLGSLELDEGLPQQALTTWAPLLQQREDFMAHFYSGIALVQLDREEEAHQLFEQAQLTMPSTHPLYSELLTRLNQPILKT